MISPLLATCLALAPAAPASRPPDAVVQPGEGFSLARALAAMREGHPLLGWGAARVDAARAATVAARVWENPVVQADYFLGVRSSSYDRAGAFVAGVGQWLPVSAVPRARREAAGHEASAVASDRDGLVRDLELRVEEAMLRLAAALREVEVQRGARLDLEESRRVVDARVEGGVAPRYDATRIRLALAEAEAALRSAEARATEARGELDVAVGPLADGLVGAPRVDLFTHPPLPPVELLREDLRAGRPDLAAARSRTRAASSGVKLARREVFPGVGLRLAAGFGQGPGQVDVGAGMSIPIPVLHRGQGFIDRARAEVRAAESVVRTLTVAAEQRLAAAHRAAEQRREASQRHVEMSQDAAEALQRQAEAGYRDGRLSVLELADASLSVRDMRLRDLDLALQARLAELALRRVVEVGGE